MVYVGSQRGSFFAGNKRSGMITGITHGTGGVSGSGTVALLSHGDSISSSGQPTADPTKNYVNVLAAYITSRKGMIVNVTRRGIGGHSFNYAWPSSGNPNTLNQDAVINVDPLASSTAILIAYIGTNGVTLGAHTPAQEVTDADTYLSARISAGFTPANIYVVNMIPRENFRELLRQEFNYGLKTLCASKGCKYVDISILTEYRNISFGFIPDQIHPSVAGHDIIAEAIYDEMYPADVWTPATVTAARPADLSLAFWLDYTDATKLYSDVAKTTLAGAGVAVAVVADKSTNGRDFVQATAGNRPTRTTLSGVSALAFASATQQHLAATGLSGMPSVNFSVGYLGEIPVGNGLYLDMSTDGSTSNAYALRSQNQSLQQIDATGAAMGSPIERVVSAVLSYPIGPAFQNGAPPISFTSTPAARTVTAARIGRGFNSGFQLNGSIIAQFLISGRINSIEAARLDRYMRAIAGLIDNDPDQIDFTDSLGQPTSTLITSNTLTVSGLGAGVQVPWSDFTASGVSPSHSLNGGAFDQVRRMVENGDTLQLRVTTSALANTPQDIIYRLGNRWVIWRVRTA